LLLLSWGACEKKGTPLRLRKTLSSKVEALKNKVFRKMENGNRCRNFAPTESRKREGKRRKW